MKILVISECIAPYQAIGSIRWSKIIKYLKLDHHTEQIDVVTLAKKIDNDQTKCDELLKEDLKYIDHYYAVPLPPFTLLYASLRLQIRKWGKRHSKSDGTVVDVQRVKAAYNLKRKIRQILEYFRNLEIPASVIRYMKDHGVQIDQYDVMITCYPPEWTHLVGRRLKKKYSDLCWIADFRDQWDFRGYGQAEGTTREKQAICADADCLLRVNPYLKLLENPGQKVVTITNGFDPDEKIAPERPELFRIVYTGTVYIVDDLDAIFQVLGQLIQANEIDRSDLSIEYAGRSGKLFTSYIYKYRFESNYVDHGHVSRQEALQLQSQAALLLMAAWNTKGEQIVWSGKMYEYMMAQKPMVYLMAGEEKDCEVAETIGFLGGVCYQTCRHEETYPQIKEYVLEKYREWKKTGRVSIKRDDEYVEQFSYPRIAEKVDQLLKEIQGNAG